MVWPWALVAIRAWLKVELEILGSAVGNELQRLLVAPDIQTGDEPSYQLCKAIFTHHPLGAKLAEAPTRIAQSQKRDITIDGSPGDQLKDAFEKEWKRLRCDNVIFNLMRTSRVYGIASMGVLVSEPDGYLQDPGKVIDFPSLNNKAIAFNVWDPLNTAGSLVLNQIPTAFDFQKALEGVSVQGTRWHPSRSVVMTNEDPIYISYTTAAFGFAGRSVYQRALLPLKSFVQTMVTDDLISLKSGVIIAKIKQAGSMVNQGMKNMFGLKRNVVKEAVVGNVISISPEEYIETLNMQNLDGAYGMARTNILKNIATAADMPAQLIENETMVSGFGEGTEDAKNIAKYVDRHREEMEPAYTFMDRIVMQRAWTPEVFEAMKAEHPDAFKGKTFETEFQRWRNSFKATWPSLLVEPDSEKAKAAKVKLEGIMSTIMTMAELVDPKNKSKIVMWAVDEINSIDFLFSARLELDFDALVKWCEDEVTRLQEAAQNATAGDPPSGGGEEGEPKPRKAKVLQVASGG